MGICSLYKNKWRSATSLLTRYFLCLTFSQTLSIVSTAHATSLTCAITVEPIYIADFDFTKSTHTKIRAGAALFQTLLLL